MKYLWIICFFIGFFTKMVEAQEVLDPAPTIPRSLFDQLADDDFEKREKAQKEIFSLGKQHLQPVVNQCLDYFVSTEDPEAKTRLKTILSTLVEGTMINVPRAFLGINMQENQFQDERGHLIPTVDVRRIIPGTSAQKIGMQVGDQIIDIDGQFAKKGITADAFGNYIDTKKIGEEITLKIRRKKELIEIEVPLGKVPETIEQTHSFERPYQSFDDWLKKEVAKKRSTE